MPLDDDQSSSSQSKPKSTVSVTRWRNEVRQLIQSHQQALQMNGDASKDGGKPSLAISAYVDATTRGLSSVLPKEGFVDLKKHCTDTKRQYMDLPKHIQDAVQSAGTPQDKEALLRDTVGGASLMGKAQPLYGAMQRRALQNFFSDDETRGILKTLDGEATSRVLEDARKRSAHFVLNKEQLALLENMADQESAREHLPAFAALAITMGKSPNEEMQKTAASLVAKIDSHARVCLAADQTEPVVDVASMLACSPVKTQAALGNHLAHDLVKSEKLQDEAKLQIQAQPLNQLLSLREFADKHEKGTGKFCLEEALETSGKLLVTARSNTAGPEKLNSLHQVHLNAHANTLKDDPASIGKAYQATLAAMDDQCPDAVDNFLSTLAHDNREQSVKLASAIVRSDEFMATFGTSPPEDPMNVVGVDMGAPQANVETATAQLMVAQAEWRLHSGSPGSFTPSISPQQLRQAGNLFRQDNDEQKVQGCLDLLCKYKQTNLAAQAGIEAKVLFDAVWKEKTTAFQSLLRKPASEPVAANQSPSSSSIESDEVNQFVNDAWEASDELIEIAGLARTMQAYSDTPVLEIDQVKTETNTVFEQALARMDYSGAVQLAAVHEALLPEKEAAAAYKHMGGKLMEESSEHLKNKDYDKALVAAHACLEIAARDRGVMQHMMPEVEKLRQDIATDLGVTMMVDHATSGHEQLLDACKKQPQLIPAANDLNDAITKANQNLLILDQVKKKIGADSTRKELGADPDHHADRFKGAVNTGCPDVHAFRYSSGTGAGDEDNEATLALAHTASAAVQSAYVDFCKADFSSWDVSKTHVRKLGELQKNWAEAEKRLPGDDATMETARQALLFDLNHIDQLQASPKTSDKPYIKEMRGTWDSCGKDVELFIQARAAMHNQTPPGEITKDYSKSAVSMLSAQAGYLLEERMYQLLPDQNRLQWNGQNTTLFPKRDESGKEIKGSRPDIVQTFDGKHNVCLDLTAQNSAGHIFKKTDAWVHSEVTEAIEITYPSLSKDVLKQSMLKGQSVDMEAIRAADARAAQTQQLKEQTRQLYKDCSNVEGSHELRENMKKPTADLSSEAAIHLAHWAGFDDASMYDELKGPVDEDYAEKALVKLTKHAQEVAESQQWEKTLPQSLANFLPPEAQKMHADLRLADDLEKGLADLQKAEARVKREEKNMQAKSGLVQRCVQRANDPNSRAVAQATATKSLESARKELSTATQKHEAAKQDCQKLEQALIEKIQQSPYRNAPGLSGVKIAREMATDRKQVYQEHVRNPDRQEGVLKRKERSFDTTDIERDPKRIKLPKAGVSGHR